MSIQDFIDILNDVPNKEAELVMPFSVGYISVCGATSNLATSNSGEEVFVVMPCYCHEDDTEIEIKAEDFGNVCAN